MRVKITQVHTDWSPEHACSMLELLDELRDQLWEIYAEQIIAYRLDEHKNTTVDQQQRNLSFDEGEPF